MTGGDRLQQAMGDPDALNFARNSVPYKVRRTASYFDEEITIPFEIDRFCQCVIFH